MTTGQDNTRKNLKELKNQQYNIKFTLDGTDYKPIENIGSGAYGVVCSALHKETKKKVAIKKIADIFDVTAIAKRTYREIKILKHFNHDNVVAIREILKPPDQLENFKDVYVVLDLMESDLHRIIYSQQELSEEHVRYFMYQILRAIKYIHSASVIHRDLKPSNLLVNENCDLKVGDFGMARGVSSDPEKHDYNLTQYVATRWYRAPEIMLGVLSYTTSVDMWSVGCIFAEMLRRKHMFPGRDLIDQLKLIIRTLGAPSREFITQCQSPMLIDFVKALGQTKPEPLSKHCPKASPIALDLLSKLLVIDPQKRMTAEEALKHPFVAKYHDPEDEPACFPVFNFDFEKQYLDSEALKTAIVAEIMEKPGVPRITPPSSNVIKVARKEVPALKNNTSKPLASGLEAFLQKMKQSQAQLNQRMTTNQQVPVVQGPKPTKEANKTECEKLKERISPEKINTKDVNLLTIGGASIQSDVEMLSAKLQNLNDTTKEENRAPPVAKTDKVVGSNEVLVDPTDAKAMIKAALIRKKQDSISEGGVGKSKPVTAHQRMKEREEKRKDKLKRVKEKKNKKKKQEKESTGLMLTSDDKSLLERWKTMQQTTVPFVHPIRQYVNETNETTHLPMCTITTSSLINQPTNTDAVLTSFDTVQTVVTASDQNKPYSVVPSIEGLSNQDLNVNVQLGSTHVPSSAAPVIMISQQNLTSDYHPPYTETVTVDAFSHIQPSFVASMTCQTATTDSHPQQPLMTDMSFMLGQTSSHASVLDTSLASSQPSTHHSAPDMVDMVTKQLSRHIGMENYFPPLLAVTPKGTGEGYGVGMDLDALLNEALSDGSKKPGDSANLDSAPLSASLLQDWLEVSGNVDLNDLEALQKEMKSPMLIS